MEFYEVFNFWIVFYFIIWRGTSIKPYELWHCLFNLRPVSELVALQTAYMAVLNKNGHSQQTQPTEMKAVSEGH